MRAAFLCALCEEDNRFSAAYNLMLRLRSRCFLICLEVAASRSSIGAKSNYPCRLAWRSALVFAGVALRNLLLSAAGPVAKTLLSLGYDAQFITGAVRNTPFYGPTPPPKIPAAHRITMERLSSAFFSTRFRPSLQVAGGSGLIFADLRLLS